MHWKLHEGELTEKDLPTTYEHGHLYNDLTRELDDHLADEIKKFPWKTYIYPSKMNSRVGIRHPGATRGGLHLDENDVILDGDMYNAGIYKPTVQDIIPKYVGRRIVLVKIIETEKARARRLEDEERLKTAKPQSLDFFP